MADYSSPAPMSLSQPRHVASSDDSSDERNTSPRATTSSKSLRRHSSSSDLPKKPRGRPPGSKNKPKPPLVITKEISPDGGAALMRPVVLEISAGADVVDSLVKFALKRGVGLTLLSGTGSVSNVTLRHPLSPAPTTVSLHGPFSLLSISGSVLPDSSSSQPSFGICLAGAQGQVFGGVVGGKVVAASSVLVVAASFSSPAFHRIPGEDQSEQERDSKPSGEALPTTALLPVYSSSVTPAAVNCQPHHTHVMPGWGHSARSPY